MLNARDLEALPSTLQIALLRSIHEEISDRQAAAIIAAGTNSGPEFDIQAATEEMARHVKTEQAVLKTILTGITSRRRLAEYSADCERLLRSRIAESTAAHYLADQSDTLVASPSLRALNKKILPRCARATKTTSKMFVESGLATHSHYQLLEDLVAEPNDPRAPAVLVTALACMGANANYAEDQESSLVSYIQRIRMAITSGSADGLSDLLWQLPCNEEPFLEVLAVFYVVAANAFGEEEGWETKGNMLPPSENDGPVKETPMQCQMLSHNWGENWRRMDLNHHVSMMKFANSRLVGRGWIKVTLNPDDPDLAKFRGEAGKIAFCQDEERHEAAWIVGVGSNPEHIIPIAGGKFVRIMTRLENGFHYHTAIGNFRFEGEKTIIAEEGLKAIGYMASTQVIDDIQMLDPDDRVIMDSNTFGDSPEELEEEGVQSVGASYGDQIPVLVVTFKQVKGDYFRFYRPNGDEMNMDGMAPGLDSVSDEDENNTARDLYCAKTLGSDPWGAFVFFNEDDDTLRVFPCHNTKVTPELEAQFSKMVKEGLDTWEQETDAESVRNMEDFTAAYFAFVDLAQRNPSGMTNVMLKRHKARIAVITHGDVDQDNEQEITAIRYVGLKLGESVQDAVKEAAAEAMDAGDVGAEICDPRYIPEDEEDCDCPSCRPGDQQAGLLSTAALDSMLEEAIDSDDLMSSLLGMIATSEQDLKNMEALIKGVSENQGKPGIFWSHLMIGLRPGETPDLTIPLKRIGKAMGAEISGEMTIRDWEGERRGIIAITHHTQMEPALLFSELEFLKKKAKPLFVEMTGTRTDNYEPVVITIEKGKTRAVFTDMMGRPIA